MLFQREFLEDSESSFEAEEEDMEDRRFYTQEEEFYTTPNYEVPPAYNRSTSTPFQKAPTQYRDVSPPPNTSSYAYDEEPNQKHGNTQYRDASPQFYGNTQYRDASPHQAHSSSYREPPPRQFSQHTYRDANSQPYSRSTHRDASPQPSSRVQYESDTRQYGRSSHRDPIPQFNTHYRDTSPQPTQYRDTSPQPTQYRDTSPQPTQYRDISPPPYQNARRFETENYDPHPQASYYKPQEQFQSQYSPTPTSTTPRGGYPPSNYPPSHLPEDSELQRPPTQSGRPTTASAQMRQRMMEQQKNKLTQRKETSTMQVSSNSNYTALNSIIYSNGILAEQDLKSNKELKGFAAPDYKFEPTTLKIREAEKLPGPIKVERTVFKDELEVEVLDEAKAVRNPKPVTPREVNAVKEVSVEKKEVRQQPVVIEESIPVAYTPPVVQSIPPPYDPNKDFPTPREPDSPRQSRPSRHSRPSPVPERSPPKPNSFNTHEESDLKTNQLKQSPDKYPPVRPSHSDHQAEASVTSNRLPSDIQTDTDHLPSPTKGVMELPPASVPEAPVREQDLNHYPPPEQVFQILQQEMRDMKRFLKRPLPKGIMLQCTISRKKGGLARLYPKYYMHISHNNTFLLAGKKRANNRTSNYLISMEKDALSVKSPFYMGKVRSNFMGTRFSMYDIGLNPKHKGANAMNAREELGVVYYVSYISGIQHLRTQRP